MFASLFIRTAARPWQQQPAPPGPGLFGGFVHRTDTLKFRIHIWQNINIYLLNMSALIEAAGSSIGDSGWGGLKWTEMMVGLLMIETRKTFDGKKKATIKCKQSSRQLSAPLEAQWCGKDSLNEPEFFWWGWLVAGGVNHAGGRRRELMPSLWGLTSIHFPIPLPRYANLSSCLTFKLKPLPLNLMLMLWVKVTTSQKYPHSVG